jgi:hypothetical protein
MYIPKVCVVAVVFEYGDGEELLFGDDFEPELFCLEYGDDEDEFL